MACHNELCDRVADQAVKAFTHTNVSKDPLVFAGCVVKRPKAKPSRFKSTKSTSVMPLLEATEQKGDLLIHNLCQNGTDSVHEMRIVNTYVKSYSVKTL